MDRVSRGSGRACAGLSSPESPRQLQEALDRDLLVGQRVRELVGVLGGALEEVGEAVLGVVGERVDVAQRRLDARDAERRAALGEGARAAHRDDPQLALGGAQRDREQPRRGRVDRAGDGALDGDRCGGHLGEGLVPDREHRVGGDHRVAQVGRLVAVEAARLDRVGRVGEVEVAGHPQQLVAGDRAAGAVAAERHVGLDRREVAAAVEDDRQLVAEREAVDAQGDGGRARFVDQRAPEQIICVTVRLLGHGALTSSV